MSVEGLLGPHLHAAADHRDAIVLAILSPAAQKGPFLVDVGDQEALRTFVGEGQPMTLLLTAAGERGIAPAYTQRLLTAKMLLTDTSMAVTDVAFSSEFAIEVGTLMNVNNPDPLLMLTHPLPNTGRVVLKAPSEHHHKGGLYEVSIRLALPDGREVNIGHTAQDDERYSDLTFARALVTPNSTSFSCCAKPLTEFKIGRASCRERVSSPV